MLLIHIIKQLPRRVYWKTSRCKTKVVIVFSSLTLMGHDTDLLLVSLFPLKCLSCSGKSVFGEHGQSRVHFFFLPVGTNLIGRGFVFPFDFFFGGGPINIKYFFLIYCCIPSLVGSASLLLDVLLISFWRKVQWKNSYSLLSMPTGENISHKSSGGFV